MIRIIWLVVSLVTVLSCHGPHDTADCAEASEKLIERVIPSHAHRFSVEIIDKDSDSLDVFEVESAGDRIVLRGNNGVSVASALHHYLKKYAHCSITWNGSNLDIPDPMPPVPQKERVTSPYGFRHYFNYCTFNYTAAWWDWKRWEREIDFMALNGINMPLALTGQNIIWYRVYRRLGFTDKELESFFSGPAYFIWFWMGNLDGWGGPLSKSFMRYHKRLQKKILRRERELGMTPVLPSFTGHVPPAFKDRYPDVDVNLVQWGEGCDIAPPTYIMSPEEPMFMEIGRMFLEEQTRVFGTDHLYSADSFNEMTPPSNDSTYLSGVADKVYMSMSQVDPEAVWVMQGWMFMDRAWYWQPTQMKALFNAVPEDRLIVLDLFSEMSPVWSRTDAFYGEKWIWNMLHNFGGRVTMYGNMETIANAPSDALNSPSSGKLCGIGLTMEAIEQNPALYALMFENIWRRDPIDLDAFLKDYAFRRYGQKNENAEKAWALLEESVYSHQPWWGNVSIITGRPTFDDAAVWTYTHIPYDEMTLVGACDLLVGEADALRCSEGYAYDLIDVVRQTLSNYSNSVQQEFARAHMQKDWERYEEKKTEFLTLIDDMDRMLGSHKDFILGKWLSDARRRGSTPKEKDLFEMNARDLITLWTGPDCKIHEYASKEWSGLLRGFYKQRWLRFFREVESCRDEGREFDQTAFEDSIIPWEWEWVNSHETYPSEPAGDPVDLAAETYEKYRMDIINTYTE